MMTNVGTDVGEMDHLLTVSWGMNPAPTLYIRVELPQEARNRYLRYNSDIPLLYTYTDFFI